MKKLITRGSQLLLSPTAKNAGIIFAGNAVSSVLGITFAVIAAYFLTPAAWGIVASVRNLINILIAIADLGLGAALFQFSSGKWKDEPQKALSAYKDIFALRIISCFLFCLALFAFSGIISQISFGFVDHTLIYLAIVGFAGVLFLDFQVFAVQSKKNWVSASILIALTNVFRVGILLWLVWAVKVNQFNVLLAFSISGIFAFLVGFLSLPYAPSFKINLSQVFRQFGNFSLWMSGNKIVSTVAARIDVLLVLQTLGAHKAGIYGIASTFAVGVPLIIGSFATILASKFASITDKGSLRDFFYKSIGLSVLVSLFLLLGVLVSPLVISLFGEKYLEAGPILQLLFIGMIPFSLSAPSVNILIYHFKKPQIIAWLSVLQLFIILGVNFYFLPVLDVYAPVLALSLSNLVTMIISYIYVFKYLK